MNDVAKTILAQFGGIKALVMIGGSAAFSDDSLTVMFRAKAKNKANRLVVRLDFDDTYTMEFWACRGASARLIASESGLYCDQIKETFEAETFLRLSL